MSSQAVARGRAMRLAGRLGDFLASARFPIFAITVVTGIAAAMLAMLLVPDGGGGLGEFVTDLKIWCFGYEPATGQLQWAYVGMVAVQPVLFAGVLALVWWGPLHAAWHRERRVLGRWFGFGSMTAAVAVAGVFALRPADQVEGPVFPAAALRTSQPAPPFALVDQDGALISNTALRGKVVLVTAVYASCGLTCPLLLGQTRRVVARAGASADDLAVVAITLDPETDTVARLHDLTEAQGVAAPLFHFVTGTPVDVNAALDGYDVQRRRDPKTGRIDHSNVIFLIDRQGRLAYRFALGAQQEDWLGLALGLLLAEG